MPPEAPEPRGGQAEETGDTFQADLDTAMTECLAEHSMQRARRAHCERTLAESITIIARPLLKESYIELFQTNTLILNRRGLAEDARHAWIYDPGLDVEPTVGDHKAAGSIPPQVDGPVMQRFFQAAQEACGPSQDIFLCLSNKSRQNCTGLRAALHQAPLPG